jgi:hypothetical protein
MLTASFSQTLFRAGTVAFGYLRKDRCGIGVPFVVLRQRDVFLTAIDVCRCGFFAFITANAEYFMKGT